MKECQQLTKEIHVVGAAIKKDNKILAVQRSEQMTPSKLWEFPGGKIEKGETKEEALIREIKEELTLDIGHLDFVTTASYDYSFGRVTLSVFTADILGGEIRLNEHADMKWLDPKDLPQLKWAPVDIPAVQKLSHDE